jgi:hypothetical protein
VDPLDDPTSSFAPAVSSPGFLSAASDVECEPPCRRPRLLVVVALVEVQTLGCARRGRRSGDWDAVHVASFANGNKLAAYVVYLPISVKGIPPTTVAKANINNIPGKFVMGAGNKEAWGSLGGIGVEMPQNHSGSSGEWTTIPSARPTAASMA